MFIYLYERRRKKEKIEREKKRRKNERERERMCEKGVRNLHVDDQQDKKQLCKKYCQNNKELCALKYPTA